MSKVLENTFIGLLRVVALDIETQTPPVSGVEDRSSPFEASNPHGNNIQKRDIKCY
jgi:hypothetical protein